MMKVCALLSIVLIGFFIFPAPASAQSEARPLPLRRVTLYGHGVGYFERQGKVDGDQQVTFTFDAAQLNDVLKSLVVLDLNKGKISSVTYDSTKPFEKRIADFGVNLNPANGTGLAALFSQLKGARVEIHSTPPLIGTVVGVERRIRMQGAERAEMPELVIMSEGGELRSLPLDQLRGIKLLDAKLREDLERQLGIFQSTLRKNARQLTITATGTGERDLFVSYVVEAPVWKTTYRVVLDAKSKPFLQGWAVVDNVQDDDWNDVSLSLIAGAPISFVHDLQQPRYKQRQVVNLLDDVVVGLQAPEASLGEASALPSLAPGISASGNGGVAGAVKDASGAAISGATITARNRNTGQEYVMTTGADGRYALRDLPAGNYTIRFAMRGFREYLLDQVRVEPGHMARNNIALEVGSITETVTVTAESSTLSTTSGRRIRSGDSGVDADVETQEIGELFEYRIAHPVTIKRNSSALIPILQQQIDAEQVSLYNQDVQATHPMSALYLHNTTGLMLASGPLTVIENETYAGEAITGRIKPGEKRFVNYAVDLGCRVLVKEQENDALPFLAELINGEFRLRYKQTKSKTYLLSNVTPRAKTVYLEHPYDHDEEWELVRTPAPVETTENYRRFKVAVPPNGTAQLEVHEELPEIEMYQVSNLTTEQVRLFMSKGYLTPQMKGALETILDMKAEIVIITRRLQEKQTENSAIAQDQTRLRENLRALGKGDEEKQLIQRYVAKLAQGEDQIEKLRGESKTLEEERRVLQQRLDDQLRKLSLTHRLRQ